MNTTDQALMRNQIRPGTQVKGGKGSGDSHPPRNSTAVIADIVRTATNSVRNWSMNIDAEYSTEYPATSSDSASARSNGVRFVSASADTKKMTNIGNSGSQYQPRMPNRVSCACTISDRLSEPAHITTVTMTNPIDTS